MTGFGGLLSADPGQLYGNPNLQDPAVQQAIANRGLLAAVGSFGESAMPTRVPTPIGAVLGKAAGAAGAGEDAAIKARTDALQGQLYGAQAQQALMNVNVLKGIVDPNSPYGKLVAPWFNQGQGPLMPNQPPSPASGGFGSNSAGTLAMLASPLGDKIRYYANYYGVDPNVFAGMINVESSGNPNALNKSSGAAGLGQLIPSNFAKYGVKNPYDVDQNLNASAHLLADNLKAANGDTNLALKYYFGGQDQSKWGKNTEAYPGLVMSRVPPAQTAAAQAQSQASGGPSAASSLITSGAVPGLITNRGQGTPTDAARAAVGQWTADQLAGRAPPPGVTWGAAPGTTAGGTAAGAPPPPAPPAAAGGPGMLPGGSVPNMTAPGGILGGLPGGARTAAAGGGAVGSPLGPGGPSGAQLAGLLGLQQAGVPRSFAGPGAAEPAPAPAATAPGMLPGGAVPDITAPGGLLSGQGAPAAAAPPPPAVPPPAAPGPPGAAPGTPLSLLKPPPTPAIPAPPTLPAAVAPTGGAATGGMSPETMRAGQALQLIGALTGHPEFGQMVTSSPQFQAAVEAAKQGAIFPYQSALKTQEGQQALVQEMYKGSIDLQKAGYEKQTEAVWGMLRDQMKPQDLRTGQVMFNPAMQSYMLNYEARGPDGLMHHYFDTMPAAGSQTPPQHMDMGTSGEIQTPAQKTVFDANVTRANAQLEKYNEARTQALSTMSTADEINDLMGRTAMGWGADAKTEAARILTGLGMTSQDVAQQWTGTNITDAQGLTKLFLQLSAGAVRGMGAREPGSVISLFQSAYPHLESDPDAARLLTNAIRMQAAYQADKSTAAQTYEGNQQATLQQDPTGRSYKGLQGFEDSFAKTNDPHDYWRAAVAMSARQEMDPQLRQQYLKWAWDGTTPEQQHRIVSLMPKGQARSYLGGDGRLYSVPGQ